jgi:hypothetical protein
VISRGLRRAATVLLAAAGAFALAGRAPAAAQEGTCSAQFNGVEAGQVASLSSPLLLDAADTLTFSGTDDPGTGRAEVAVLLGPVTLAGAASTPGTVAAEFGVELSLAQAAEDGVGLLRVRGTTDHCTVEGWLRVGGRSPLGTTAGLMAIGLGVAGLAGMAAALLARRSWSPWVAGVAGLLAGAGGALLAQQAGRLQLSYWSLAACALPAAAAGVGLALFLRHRRVAPAAEAPARAEPAGEPPDTRVALAVAAPTATPAARSAPVAELPSARREATPYWGYVLADMDVLHLDDYRRVVATLHPGTWYLVEREASGWAQVEAEPGVEGWVPRRAVHRQE